MSLIKQVRETIRRYNLLNRNDKIVVGVSGGPDSVALILILNSLRKELKLVLHIAHLDHQLREDSYQDKIFVESLARKLNLPFTWGRIDITSRKGSIEEIAREARLKFLFSLAKKVGAHKIALGHNQDDQAETVLMRLIRGTGLFGLASILPKRKIDNWTIIRPLIETSRKTIESYLKRRKVKARIDSSNKDLVFFRNRIRNQLIPELIKDYNPNTREVLASLAQVAACDYDYLENTAIKTLRRIKRPLTKNRYRFTRGSRLNLNKLSRLHPAIQRLVLRLSIAQIRGTTRRLSFRHIKEIGELISCRPINSIVDLPDSVSVLKDKKYLCIYQRRLKKRSK
jgi:tRNA(Ile)-lysidine synthase